MKIASPAFQAKGMMQATAVTLLTLLLTSNVTVAQDEAYLYRDKKYKLEVNLPKKPATVDEEPPFLRKVVCLKTLDFAFLTLILPAEVKVGKQSFPKSVEDRFRDVQANTAYSVVGSRQFKVGTIDVIEWWGLLNSGAVSYEIVDRLVVYKEAYYQFQITSNTKIAKDYSYPFLNSIKIDGIAIQSPDHDPSRYKTFVFEQEK